MKVTKGNSIKSLSGNNTKPDFDIPSKTRIVLITDENYVMPTSVAIQSIVDSKEYGRYEIILVASDMSEESYSIYKSFERQDISIRIIADDAEKRFSELHKGETSICVATKAALLKFVLPELLPDLDRVLYLDGDLIVKKDLNELFCVDLGTAYVAAVRDSGAMYYKHKYVKDVPTYFNSGVMLLNLEAMRKNNLTEKLIETKKNMADAMLMDQNAFNLVMNGHVKTLPIRYNFMPVSLYRAYDKWKIEDVNTFYETHYSNKKELLNDAAIIHYSSKDKPWKELDGFFAAEWIHYYKRTPLKSHDLCFNEDENYEYGISVIMPCYNTGKYVGSTLDCLLDQKTEIPIEIICIDDGSTDDTYKILKEYEKRNPNISVIADSNKGQGYQRNVGIQKAKGKYVYFMDSDDLLEQGTFLDLYEICENSHLDIVYFEGRSVFESHELERRFEDYKTCYCRKEWFYKVFRGDELYINLRRKGGYNVSPCMQLIRRNFLIQNHIKFPAWPMLEDNIFVYHSMKHAKRTMVVPRIYYVRLVREGSTMTCSYKHVQKLECLYQIILDLAKDIGKIYNSREYEECLALHIKAYKKQMMDVARDNRIDEEVFTQEQREHLREIDELCEKTIAGNNLFPNINMNDRIDFSFSNENGFFEVELRKVGAKKENGVAFVVKHEGKIYYYTLIDRMGKFLPAVKGKGNKAGTLDFSFKNDIGEYDVEFRNIGGQGENGVAFVVCDKEGNRYYYELLNRDGTPNWVNFSTYNRLLDRVTMLEKTVQEMQQNQSKRQNILDWIRKK